MKIARRKIPQRAELLSLLFALALVWLIAILSYRAWEAFGDRSQQLAISKHIVLESNTLLSALKDAETGQRGFLLTGRERYLEPYLRAEVEIPAALNRLAAATVPRPDQTRRVNALRPLIAEKLEELKRTIELHRSHAPDAALAIVLSDRSQAVMDQIRQTCTEIERGSYARLTQQSEQARASANQIGFVSILGALALFALLVLSTITVQRGTHRRQQLIQELQQSGEQTEQARDWLSTTIASIGDGVIATDAAGQVTFLNHVAESLTGWTQEEAAGKPLEEIFIISHEETGAPAENPVSKVLREGGIVGLANHTKLTAREGRHTPIDDSAAPIRDADGKISGVVLVFRDVTAQREAEKAIAESEERFRSLVSIITDVPWTADPEGRFVSAQPAWAAYTGQSWEELKDFGWADALHPDDRRKILEDWEGARKARTLHRDQGRLWHAPTQQYRHFEVRAVPLLDQDGTVREWVGACTDCQERVRSEAALRESTDRLNFMAESMPQKIFTAKPNGDVDYFNRQWTEFTGLSLEQIKEWGWTQFIHPQDVEENVRVWKHSIATGDPFQFLHRFRRADGVYRWHLSRACAMRDAQGDISMWIGSNTDIHEQKENEEELRRANEDLNQFAFAASHDLQEPLRMISSYSQLLVRGYRGQLEGEAALCVNFITAGTERMSGLLADLLAYTQVNADNGSGETNAIDLNVVFQKTIQNLRAAIDDSKAVVTGEQLPAVSGRESHFVQLLQNLIGNAIKYRGERAPHVHVSATKIDDLWRLAVADNGMGIDPEYHQRIFGVFKRLHGKNIPGTGIGLAICQRIVNRYGGQIWVESKLNHGATFYCTLPAAKGSTDER